MSRPSLILRVCLAMLLASGLSLLISCGGGTGVASSTSGSGSGVGSGGTGSYTIGDISGLGSIIVNGVRYDVSQAQVIDDAGTTQSASVLALGMTVELTSGSVTTSSDGTSKTASAAQVRYASALVGPVEVAPDSGCSCMTVLGQTVRYSTTSVMPTDLVAGDVVEVYGQSNLYARALVATRIDRVTDSRPYKLVGVVQGQSGLNTSARLLTVQGPTATMTVTYSTDSQVSALSLGDDDPLSVRVWVSRTVDANARHALQQVDASRALVTERDEASLGGLVTQALDSSGRIGIQGVLVQLASTASSEVRTAAAALAIGDRVLVEGALVGGTLQVTEIHTGSGDDDDDIELHGAPSAYTDLGNGQATMVVREVTVLFTISDAPANVASQSCVEVKGQSFDSQGRLLATQIEVESSCH